MKPYWTQISPKAWQLAFVFEEPRVDTFTKKQLATLGKTESNMDGNWLGTAFLPGGQPIDLLCRAHADIAKNDVETFLRERGLWPAETTTAPEVTQNQTT